MGERQSSAIVIKKYERNSHIGETISDIDFEPDDAEYFFENHVENYDRVVITFYGLNMPRNRLKLRVIDFGQIIYFFGNQLHSLKVMQEIDPISSQIGINTTDFAINSEKGINYNFQAKQPLLTYFNGELRSKTFVSSAKRKNKYEWNIQSEDYISLLDSAVFAGGMYNKKNAVDLLKEIFDIAKAPYAIDEAFAYETVTGHIPYTTCREALIQVAFAIQAAVDTSESDVINVFKLNTDITQTVPLSRIMAGQSFTAGETITAVELASHAYVPVSESEDVYKAIDSGTGADILVLFSEPLHSLQITNGKISQSSANYAIITANENCVLTGYKYSHAITLKRKDNPMVLAADPVKISSITDATLI